MYGDQPYIHHLVRVAIQFDDLTLRVVGLLHDIVEDTPVTVKEIEYVFGPRVGLAVSVLTHKKGTPYLAEYIPRVAKNSDARSVKLADLADHLYHIENVYPGRFDSLKPRYLSAWEFLTGHGYPEK